MKIMLYFCRRKQTNFKPNYINKSIKTLKKMKNLFTFIVALFMATSVYAQTETATVKEWNFSNWTKAELTENKTIDGLSVYATADKKMVIDGSTKTVDGVKYTQRFKLSGTGNVANESSLSRVLSFEVTGPSDIYIVAAHAGTKTDDPSRPLVIASYTDNDFTSLTELGRITYNVGRPTSSTVKYTGTKTAKILIYSSNSGINLYDIKVTPATSSDKVTITEAGFATFAASYPVDYSANGLEAYAVKYANGTLSYNKINGIVPANTAVLLSGEAKEYTLAAAGGAATTVDTDLRPSDGNKIGAENIYCLANKTSNGVGFYQVKSGVIIPANKAYLEIATSTSTPAKYYSIGIGGNTTGIQAIQQNSVKADGIMYSLSGQRVGKDYKGIVICNGKKMNKK